jgi:hypothetical protein
MCVVVHKKLNYTHTQFVTNIKKQNSKQDYLVDISIRMPALNYLYAMQFSQVTSRAKIDSVPIILDS